MNELIPEEYRIKIDMAISELLQANSDANLPLCARQGLLLNVQVWRGQN